MLGSNPGLLRQPDALITRLDLILQSERSHPPCHKIIIQTIIFLLDILYRWSGSNIRDLWKGFFTWKVAISAEKIFLWPMNPIWAILDNLYAEIGADPSFHWYLLYTCSVCFWFYCAWAAFFTKCLFSHCSTTLAKVRLFRKVTFQPPFR